MHVSRVVAPTICHMMRRTSLSSVIRCCFSPSSMQVPTLQSIVKRLIPGVEPDLTEGRRGDDQDEANAEQHDLASLRRSYAKHHQHLGHKAPPSGWGRASAANPSDDLA